MRFQRKGSHSLVTQDVLLSSGQVFTTGTLQLLDVLLAHVDQERQIGRVTPQADCARSSLHQLRLPMEIAVRRTLAQFPEDELVRLELQLVRQAILMLERLNESRSQFKDGSRRSGKGVALLPEEDIVFDPVFAQGETFSQSSVLVSFGEQPRGVHKVLALEVLGDFLVPQGNVSSTVIDDGSQFRVFGQVVHEIFHSVNAGDQVGDAVFVRLRA